jgi:hypothetical protein
MNYEDDLDLERRLRRISEDSEPAVPGSLYRYLDQVAEGTTMTDEKTSQTASVALVPQSRRSVRSGRPQLKALMGVAAALAVAVAVGTLLIAVRGTGTGATPPVAPDPWTALEWHDITATSDRLVPTCPSLVPCFGPGSPAQPVVSWPGGLIANGAAGQWASKDGQTWSHVPGSPTLMWLGAIGSKLIGVAPSDRSCPSSVPSGSTDTCAWPGGIGISADGVSWQAASVPWSRVPIAQFIATSKGAIVVAQSGDGRPALYASRDGVSWSMSTIPDDLAAALGGSLGGGYAYAVREGYVAMGPVANCSAAATGLANCGDSPAYSWAMWSSSDGVTWSRSEPKLPENWSGLGPIHRGLLGDASVDGTHSTDGVTWTVDASNGLLGTGDIQITSDGRHILLVEHGNSFVAWNSALYVSLGDGRWQKLSQGGDVGGLPSGGQAFLLPNGVLYAAGGQLYFGQAVSGTPVQETAFATATSNTTDAP